MKVKAFTMDGKDAGSVELDDNIFNAEVKKGAIYEALKNELANLRWGNHKVKNRVDVRGGGIKPWRQKGTGRARQGSIRAPQWRGGGIVHGPQARDYSYQIPRKMKRAAILSVLSQKANSENIVVIKNLGLEKHSTKTIADMVKGIKWNDRKNVTLVLGDDDKLIKKSSSNIPNLNTLVSNRLSIRGLLHNQGIMLAESAIEKLKEQYGA